MNGCPMRRINQNYLLATKTSVDVSAVKLPENVNDDYFKVRQVDNPFKLLFLEFEKKISSNYMSSRSVYLMTKTISRKIQ